MGAVIVAPIHEPVVRLRLRLQEPLVWHAAGDRLSDRLAEVAPLLHSQIRDDVGDFRRRQSRRIVVRHQRAVLDRDRCGLQLVDQMQLAVRVDHLNRKLIFIAANTTNLASVLRAGDDRDRWPGATSTAASASAGGRRQRLVRRHNFLMENGRNQSSPHSTDPVR